MAYGASMMLESLSDGLEIIPDCDFYHVYGQMRLRLL